MGLSHRATLWAMRAVGALCALLVTLFSVMDHLLMHGGPLKAYLLLAIMMTTCGLFAPLFWRSWLGSIDQVIMAGLLIGILTTGTSWALMVASGVVFFGDPVSELLQIPKMFFSGAILSPLLMILYPGSLLVSVCGMIIVVCLARSHESNKRLYYAQHMSVDSLRGQMNGTSAPKKRSFSSLVHTAGTKPSSQPE